MDMGFDNLIPNLFFEFVCDLLFLRRSNTTVSFSVSNPPLSHVLCFLFMEFVAPFSQPLYS